MRITDLVVTPIAFADPPLLTARGVHEPLVLRCVVQLVVEDGALVGLGEAAGDRGSIARLRAVREKVLGLDVFAPSSVEAAVDEALGAGASVADRLVTFSALEVACLDAQGKAIDRPVSELLGGAVRDTVPYAAHLFYKWAGHPGAADDEWGAALDPDGIVLLARRMIDRHGFGAITLTGGVFPPAEEIDAIRALRAAFPAHALRIDASAAWTVPTARRAARELGGVLEYLGDPVDGIEAMAAVAQDAPMPLASTMAIAPALTAGAARVVLADHHTWGGLARTRHLATLCDTVGLGLAMHSTSHLGISLAATTHLAAACPALSYACDTQYPWNAASDIVRPGALQLVDGGVAVPRGPGLGVELDPDALERAHLAYLASGRTHRDDTAYMRTVQPDFDPALPRW
jgi:glucarate dehydratase